MTGDEGRLKILWKEDFKESAGNKIANPRRQGDYSLLSLAER
jgi:hypothetical protein